MEQKELKLIFKYKEDLINYGQERLYNEMTNVIKDVDKKYIIKSHAIDKRIYSLFGFKDDDELKEKLNKLPVNEFELYIKIFTENIFKSLENNDSFISRCLKDVWEENYRNLQIEFNLKKYGQLELSIMSISKNNGCGSGEGFNFDVIDLEHLNTVIEEVNNLDVPISLKNMYIDFFNSESEDGLDLIIAKEWIIEGIVEAIDNFIYQNENKYKQYKSLYKQNVKEELIKFIGIENWICDISDTIAVDYGIEKATSYDILVNDVKCKECEYYTNENKIEIKFLGEVVKTISKSSYTVYEIN